MYVLNAMSYVSRPVCMCVCVCGACVHVCVVHVCMCVCVCVSLFAHVCINMLNHLNAMPIM